MDRRGGLWSRISFAWRRWVAGLRRKERRAQPVGDWMCRLPRAAPRLWEEDAAPRLGELLVHKYRAVSRQELERALEEQRKHGGMLGHILVRMRALGYSQLLEALEEQLTYGEAWWGRGASGGVVKESLARVD